MVLFRLHLWLPTFACHLSMTIVSPGRHPRCRNDGVMNSRASSDSNTIEASNEFITFGCLNIRSITSKFEVLTDVTKDKTIDILSLTKTWHEGSIAFFQRRQGFTVIDCHVLVLSLLRVLVSTRIMEVLQSSQHHLFSYVS